MTAVQSPEPLEHAPNGSDGVKRTFPTTGAGTFPQTLNPNPARRDSTVLNPRSYVAEELSKKAPVFVGSTRFEPLQDAKNILVTGGAGFMYVNSIVLVSARNTEC